MQKPESVFCFELLEMVAKIYFNEGNDKGEN
jgi:hypothetical protein